MAVKLLIPDGDYLKVQDLAWTETCIIVCLTSSRETGDCPACGQPSGRIHSRYRRTVADLPWGERPVYLRLWVRKFFCTTPSCPRHVFSERWPQVAAAWGRRTPRLEARWRWLGLALGGEAGSRTAARVHLPTSPDTLLRVVRRTPRAAAPPPRVVGVDEWALRKGHRYGAIVVDLERRYPVEVLPDRTAATMAAWLEARPGIEIVSRDRGGAFAEAARQGAPAARQVADRWHLLKNAGDTLQRLVDRSWRHLRPALQAIIAPTPVLTEVTLPASEPAPPAPRPLSRAVQAQQAGRERRLARYEQVMALHAQGTGLRGIARQLRLDRRTVRRYVRAGAFPERDRIPSILDPFEPYLRQRWDEGCHKASQLLVEIRAQGYRGGLTIVIQKLQPWRQRTPHPRVRRRAAQPALASPAIPTVRQVTQALRRPQKRRSSEQARLVEQVCAAEPVLQQAHQLVQDFHTLVTQRQATELDAWLERAAASGVSEFDQFVVGLRRDYDAVLAALELPWSQGQVEGQINRVKAIRRQMYGRGKLDLLRQRVLLAH